MIHVVETIANLTDALVVALLTGGIIVAGVRAARLLYPSPFTIERAELHRIAQQLRIDLGHILLLALEILIISDILHSIVRRTFEELGILAITVVIRIALSFFLDRELASLEKSLNGNPER